MNKAEHEKILAGYNRVIGSKNIILLCTSGSEVLGLNKAGSSDRDEVGVYIEDISEAIGFSSQSHVEYRSARERTGIHDARSESGDIDLTLYGLRKFLMMSASGNPNILQLFFTPEKMCKVITPLGRELQAMHEKVISKRAGVAFLGYLQAQKNRLLGRQGQKRVNRQELEEQFGFDTHYAMHMMRLGLQSIELLSTGRLCLPMEAENAAILKYVKRRTVTLDECINYTSHYEDSIRDLMVTTKLSESPDYNYLEKWMLEVYNKTWKEQYENKTASQQQRIETSPQGQDPRTDPEVSKEIDDSIPF
jgi:predicted nucleotidyltransferase